MCNKTENTRKVLQEFYNWLFNYQTNQKEDRTLLYIMDTENILNDSSISTTTFDSEINYTFDSSLGLKFTKDNKELTITKVK